ncbi:DUF3592 domain-containing protein [uncultured Lacinutrix sp.]|uniref:DUF3592 domain-containing protein n=1 Tax=uncultured Lacinutrix sp. TaxID=574032 RepID=UPI00263194BC|nr:DUF3592 domain-containing protein [uncultured Lacinutrix sp.]
MKAILFITLSIISFFSYSQEETPNFVDTEAKITELSSQASGRRSTTTATVNFTTNTGKNITSKVRLLHIPFLGSFKEVGDSIAIKYDTNNPYIVKSKSDSFINTYGIYILIVLGVFISLNRYRKNKKSVS